MEECEREIDDDLDLEWDDCSGSADRLCDVGMDALAVTKLRISMVSCDESEMDVFVSSLDSIQFESKKKLMILNWSTQLTKLGS